MKTFDVCAHPKSGGSYSAKVRAGTKQQARVLAMDIFPRMFAGPFRIYDVRECREVKA